MSYNPSYNELAAFFKFFFSTVSIWTPNNAMLCRPDHQQPCWHKINHNSQNNVTGTLCGKNTYKIKYKTRRWFISCLWSSWLCLNPCCFLPIPASLLSSVHKPGRLFTFTLTHTSAALLPVLTLVNASYYGTGDYVAPLKLKRLKKSTWLNSSLRQAYRRAKWKWK